MLLDLVPPSPPTSSANCSRRGLHDMLAESHGSRYKILRGDGLEDTT
jgi:hypothetical protein